MSTTAKMHWTEADRAALQETRSALSALPAHYDGDRWRKAAGVERDALSSLLHGDGSEASEEQLRRLLEKARFWLGRKGRVLPARMLARL